MISTRLSSSDDSFLYGKTSRLTKKKKKTGNFEYSDFTPKTPYKKEKRKCTARTWDDYIEE